MVSKMYIYLHIYQISFMTIVLGVSAALLHNDTDIAYMLHVTGEGICPFTFQEVPSSHFSSLNVVSLYGPFLCPSTL